MSGKRVLDANWGESALTVGWFAFVFSLSARAWLRAKLREAAVQIGVQEPRR
jgi:hypothetical protein